MNTDADADADEAAKRQATSNDSVTMSAAHYEDLRRRADQAMAEVPWILRPVVRVAARLAAWRKKLLG